MGGINTYSKEYERAKKEFYNCLRMSIFGLGVPIYIALHEWWPIMQREKQKALDEASAELFNPTPTTDFAEANRNVRTLQFEIDRYTLDWEEAATELEKLK